MKKIIPVVLLLITISPTFAAEESIRDFANDLQQIFGIEAKKTLEVGSRTRFAPPLFPSNTAEASYNPVLNTIFLKKENLGANNYVKSITALKAMEPVTYPVKISTIFHELGHAEMDQFVLNDITVDDRALHSVFTNEITPWVKKNYPGVNPKTLFHETYGYYRGSVIETMFNDKATIEIYNGWNSYQKRCFFTPDLKAKVMTMTKEDFAQIMYPENNSAWEEKYSSRFVPRYVFIQGKDVDLMKNPADPFKEQWKKAIWNYFSQNYRSPSNMRELAVYFKTHHQDRNLIRDCRNAFWDESHK